MATITQRGDRWRALVRRAGHRRCATFGSQAAAGAWAAAVEQELTQFKATGVLPATELTLGELIDRYTRERYASESWGRSKSADLARLRRDFGAQPASTLSAGVLTTHFRARLKDGRGRSTTASQLGYLVSLLRTARREWRLDLPLQAALDTRAALAAAGLHARSRRRDRRVSDDELATLCDHFESQQQSDVPMAEILRFCVASAMRIAEVCRLEWKDLRTADRTILVPGRGGASRDRESARTVPLLNATGFDAYDIAKRQPNSGPRIFPYNRRTVSAYFTRAVRHLALDDLRLHDLRHEALSRLFAAGYRIEQIALVSGHRDWAPLRRYTRVAASDLHRDARERTAV